MFKRFAFVAVALFSASSVSLAGPKAVRECPGGNCPAVPATSAAYYLPAVNPDVPERITVAGVSYVRESAPAKPSAIRPEPKAPAPAPIPAAAPEICVPCGAALPAASAVPVYYPEQYEARTARFGSCGSSGRLSLGICGGSSGGPIRKFVRSIFGGCGG